MRLKRTITVQFPASSEFPAFAPIVSEAFEQFKCLPEGSTIAGGTIVIEQGTHPSYVYLLREGLVKLVHTSPDGRETVLGLRTAGWYPGAISVLVQTPINYSIKTVKPCILSKINADEFASKLMQSHRLMRHFMNTLCVELISQSAEAQVKSKPAEQRLEQFMFERDIHHPQVKTMDPLPLLKQMELAQLLAITPEHLSRLLHKTTALLPRKRSAHRR